MPCSDFARFERGVKDPEVAWACRRPGNGPRLDALDGLGGGWMLQAGPGYRHVVIGWTGN